VAIARSSFVCLRSGLNEFRVLPVKYTNKELTASTHPIYCALQQTEECALDGIRCSCQRTIYTLISGKQILSKTFKML
jgi:hypothetical protein